jgi:predicted Rossmann-fold nucleotide-binding protein
MIALKQLGEHKKPIVLFSVDGFWDDLVKIYEGIIKEKFAKEDHIDLFTVATNVDEVIDAIHTEQKDNSDDNWRM